MRKLMSIICAVALTAISLASCQKEDMIPEPDSQDFLSDELVTKAPAGSQTSGVEPVFSVSPRKKVFFTKGNLYWNGNDWKFESAQTNYPTKRDPDHVGHFFWTKTAAAARAEKYSDGICSLNDRFFADGGDPDHMLTVEGQSELYVLSMKEWEYLLSAAPKGRGAGDSYFKADVNVNGVEHCLVIAPDGYTGKIASSYNAASWADAEASGLVCLPAADWVPLEGGGFVSPGGNWDGAYWSSSAAKLTFLYGKYAYVMRFVHSKIQSTGIFRFCGLAIRLVSTASIFSGAAKATIKGKEVDVEWVQLWKGGPKFAVKNVGADTCTDKGSMMTYAAAIKTGEDYVWGSNWRTPTKKEMGLLNDPHKVKCEFCQIDGKYGFKFTGVQSGYTDTYLFFPSDYGIMDHSRWSVGRASYWSSTMAPGIDNAWAFRLFYMRGECSNSWGATDRSDKLYVRPVLNE